MTGHGLHPLETRCTFTQQIACGKLCLKEENSGTEVPEFLCVGIDLSSRAVSSQVLSALVSLTAVFGMGTGGPSPLKTPTFGTPSGTRTLDTLIKSQVLYQLS